MSKENRVVVLIPCYNESATIAKVISDFKRELPEAEIFVYDNNSSDHTDMIALEAGATVRYERKQGKGNVVRTMFRDIDADCYVLVDGDDTYPAEAVRELIKPVLEEAADMVIGDRLSTTYYTENKRAFHNFGNRIVKKMINKIFHGRVNDIMTGYRAFGKEFVKSIPIMSKGFEIETEMTVHALDKNMNIVEHPIEYRDRPVGSESKLNTFSDGIKVIRTIIRLFRDYKPLTYFSIIAIFFMLVGGGFFTSVVIDFVKTGLVLRFPTLIISVFLMIIAILFWMCGMILHVIVAKHRQQYELHRNILKKLYQ